MLYIKEGDQTVAEYPVAIGRDSKPTPTGNYTIRRIVWNPAWIPPDEKWAKGKRPQAPGAAAVLARAPFPKPNQNRLPRSPDSDAGERLNLGAARAHGPRRSHGSRSTRIVLGPRRNVKRLTSAGAPSRNGMPQ